MKLKVALYVHQMGVERRDGSWKTGGQSQSDGEENTCPEA